MYLYFTAIVILCLSLCCCSDDYGTLNKIVPLYVDHITHGPDTAVSSNLKDPITDEPPKLVDSLYRVDRWVIPTTKSCDSISVGFGRGAWLPVTDWGIQSVNFYPDSIVIYDNSRWLRTAQYKVYNSNPNHIQLCHSYKGDTVVTQVYIVNATISCYQFNLNYDKESLKLIDTDINYSNILGTNIITINQVQVNPVIDSTIINYAAAMIGYPEDKTVKSGLIGSAHFLRLTDKYPSTFVSGIILK